MKELFFNNIEYFISIYFIVNSFITGVVFNDSKEDHYIVKILIILLFLLLGLFIFLWLKSENFIRVLNYNFHISKIFNLMFHPNLKKGNITPNQIYRLDRELDYFKNSKKLRNKIYRWYGKVIKKRFSKQ